MRYRNRRDCSDSQRLAGGGIVMTEDEFEKAMDKYELDYQYSEYLMNKTNARIGNGDALIRVMESGDYYDDFKDYMCGESA